MQDRGDPRKDQAAAVGATVEAFLTELSRMTGIEPYIVQAGAHAVLVDMMTETVGGPMTAAALDQAAERVRNEPSKRALALAIPLKNASQ